MTYDIEFTPLAKAFAEAKSSIAEVEAHVREEIDSATDNDDEPEGFFSLEIADQLFVCVCNGKGQALLDTGTFEEGPILDKGPYKGKRVMFPRPDSLDR